MKRSTTCGGAVFRLVTVMLSVAGGFGRLRQNGGDR
jgi:hypothetical protein